jgi:hypothetical protein
VPFYFPTSNNIPNIVNIDLHPPLSTPSQAPPPQFLTTLPSLNYAPIYPFPSNNIFPNSSIILSSTNQIPEFPNHLNNNNINTKPDLSTINTTYIWDNNVNITMTENNNKFTTDNPLLEPTTSSTSLTDILFNMDNLPEIDIFKM